MHLSLSCSRQTFYHSPVSKKELYIPYQLGIRPCLFRGQTIFIPGGGGGLGRCIAHEIAPLGARGALCTAALVFLWHGIAADVSAMVVFLMSEMAAYITGADFRVDGGKHNGSGSFLYKSVKAHNVSAFNGLYRDGPAKLSD